MPVSIRRAVPSDTALVVEFNQRLAEESEGKNLESATLTAGVAAALADPAKAVYYLAVQGETIVGQIMLTTEWSDWRNGWIWWIQSVYVRAEARRQGVFRALYEHVHQLALVDPGVVGLRLYVEQENHTAQATYASLGMKPAGYLVLERYPL